MATAHINIGSNIGDRHALVGQAVAAVERAFAAPAVCSSAVESAPWGYDSPNAYINVGLNIEVGSMPAGDVMCLLRQIQDSIDSSSHRDPSGAYVDRRIDIDLIAIDSLVLSTPQLTLPHPRMHLRHFVLGPMAEVWPGWIHPVLDATPAELLGMLPGKEIRNI